MSLSTVPNEILLEIASYLPISSLNAFLRTNSNLSHLLSRPLLKRATEPANSLPALFAALGSSNRHILSHVLTHGFVPHEESISFTIYTTEGMEQHTHRPPTPPTPELLTLLTTYGATTKVSAKGATSTPLSWAIYYNRYSAFYLIPRSDVSTSAQFCFSYLNFAPIHPTTQSPLHIAAACEPHLIPELLAAGASPRVRDSRGYTPLHTAASLGIVLAVQYLLDARVDPDGWHNNTVWTPLALAAWYGHRGTVRALLVGDVQVNRVLRTGGNQTGTEGWNVLHRLVARMSVNHSREIWDDTKRKQRERWSEKWKLIFRMLMKRGADPTAPDAKGRSARVLARCYGMGEVAEVLGEVYPWEKVGYEWFLAGGWGKVMTNEVGTGGVGVVQSEKAWRVQRRMERDKLMAEK